ncbi:MAG: hypothetical protein KAH32_05505 [Chlamydiia bacterium]|nr:hypothetical protein [Chlamydiia bacterium]
MSTNLIIYDKELILDLPESFELDYNAFEGGQQIQTVPTTGARWVIHSDTVNVSLEAQDKILRYSMPSNISDSVINHLITYTNVITSEVFNLTILQKPIAKLYEPYENIGFFKTENHQVYEIEFIRLEGFNMQIILDHSDITLSNSMFSIHSIVQKQDPIIRIQILKTNLSIPRETDLTLTINGIEYTSHVVSRIEPSELVCNPHMTIDTRGNKYDKQTYNTGIEYDGDIMYRTSGDAIWTVPTGDSLQLITVPNRSFYPKSAIVGTYVDNIKIQDIVVKIKAGIYIESASKVLNSMRINFQISDATLLRIIASHYYLDGKSYPIVFEESSVVGNGGVSGIKATIISNQVISNGGNLSLVLAVGNKKKYINIKIN